MYCFYNILRYYEQSELGSYMKRTLKSNDLFVDVGANMGFYSYLAKRAGARAIAFEPEPMHADFLSRNPQCYDTLYPIALSDNASTSTFYVGNELNTGIHSLVLGDQSFNNSDYADAVEVQTRRLDRLLTDDTNLDQLKLIKIDVEGAEEDVINGTIGIMKEGFKPKIWCEVRGEQSDRNGGNYQTITNILSAYGYAPYVVQRGDILPFNQKKHVAQVFDLLFIA